MKIDACIVLTKKVTGYGERDTSKNDASNQKSNQMRHNVFELNIHDAQ